jgi:hypothetical protein
MKFAPQKVQVNCNFRKIGASLVESASLYAGTTSPKKERITRFFIVRVILFSSIHLSFGYRDVQNSLFYYIFSDFS